MGKDFSMFRVMINEIKAYIDNDLAEDALIEVETFILKNFRDQSFDGKPWPKRDITLNPKKYSIKERKKDAGRAILVKSAALRDSTTKNNHAVGKTIHINSDLPYANIHNKGGKVRNFTMPQRQFLGQSETLTNNIKVMALLEIDNIINMF